MLELTQPHGNQVKATVMRAMRMYDAQEVLFSPRVSRLALKTLELPTGGCAQFKVNVWRNHAIESLLSLAEPYCIYGGLQTNFRISGYDDTLIFADRRDADVELLWLDSSRFLSLTPFNDWLQWLGGRLRALRSITKAPVMLATWSEQREEAEALSALSNTVPAVYFIDMRSACVEAGVPLLDPRSATFAGSPVGKSAQLVLARKLGCHWLPAVLLAPVKAVVLDLDNTLHSGVLGEDGIQGVQLTHGHAELQRLLKLLRQRGIFLALASRNERSDVEALFEQRQDYPLRWEDFSAIEISWGDKADALKQIANTLRIAPNAMLFVDDNPVELANVEARLPQVKTVLAHPDAALTQQVVYFYPGIWRWKEESEDAKRIQDLKANAQRDALAESIDTMEEYFRSLEVTLVYRNDPQEQLSRLAELCNKSNQFNLALRRMNQAEVAERLGRTDACVTSIELTDRFSDSGVIAVVIAEREIDKLVVEELCISCRAIGRQLENTIILLALRNMPIFNGCREVVFQVQHGPRNRPALDWLTLLLLRNEVPSSGLHSLAAQRLLDFVPADGISLKIG